MLTLLSNLFRCTCGKCDINLVHNISECYCCKELEGCAEALESDLVVQDLGEGVIQDLLQCVCRSGASDWHQTNIEQARKRSTDKQDQRTGINTSTLLVRCCLIIFSLIDAVYLFDRLLPFGSNSPFKNRKCI